MITATTLADVSRHVSSDDEGKWDLLVNLSDLELRNGHLVIKNGKYSSLPRVLMPNSWAQSQLCAQLGMPSSYFRRCPADLQDVQFNHWLGERIDGENNGPGDRQLVLRAKRETLRGVVTPRYTKLDNAKVVKALESVLPDHLQVCSFALTETSFHLRLLHPQTTVTVKQGDDLMAGLHLINSEVGQRAVTVDALVYRLVCTNGLIRLVRGKSLVHQRHVGAIAGRVGSVFEEAIKVGMAEAATALAQVVSSSSRRVDDPVQFVQTLAADNHLSDSLTEQLVRGAAASNGKTTLYDVINLVTNAAQQYQPDERYDLELMAGRLLDQVA